MCLPSSKDEVSFSALGNRAGHFSYRTNRVCQNCAISVLDPVVKSHGSFSFIHFLPWTYMSGNKGYPHRKRGHLEGEALDDERM